MGYASHVSTEPPSSSSQSESSESRLTDMDIFMDSQMKLVSMGVLGCCAWCCLEALVNVMLPRNSAGTCACVLVLCVCLHFIVSIEVNKYPLRRPHSEVMVFEGLILM